MFGKWLVLAALVAVAAAGRSPHADAVDEFQKGPDGSRFSDNVYEDARLDVESLIRKYGYPFESHQVVTSDGYILTAQRIPHGRDQNNQPGPRPAVLIMHGLLSSSADFVVLGPGSALSYTLAEAGYDVWLLNARGNTFSRNHTTLDPNRRGDTEFWQFSWDEIGYYDVPAYIDYVLEITGQTKVHYVGYSQGGTSFLVAASLRPEYNDKIISFQGLAPAAYFHNSENFFFLLLSPYERILLAAADRMGIYEVLGYRDLFSVVTFHACRDSSALQPLCLYLIVNGANMNDFNSTMLPILLGHVPAGASFRQVVHYAQSIKDGTFSRFNYGALRNLVVYGRVTPPPYDMSKITAKSYLHYGLNDIETNWRDILYLSELLPNSKAIQVPRPSFTHYDFVFGIDVKTQVYDTMIETMRDAEKNV